MRELRESALDKFVLHRVADGRTLTFLEILSEPKTLLTFSRGEVGKNIMQSAIILIIRLWHNVYLNKNKYNSKIL